MDEETLVDRLIAEGARLEHGLVRRFPAMRHSKALVALDVSLQEWQILLPLPAGTSRLQLYNGIQEIIQELELSLTVDRIALVKANDPGLKELRGSSSSPYAHHGGINQDPIDVAGRLFASPRELRVDSRLFEQQIFELLRSGLGSYAQVLTGQEAARVGGLEIGSQYISLHETRVLNYVDVLVLGQSSLLLIEAKAARHPVTMSGVLSGLGLLSYFQRLTNLRPPISMIFISASGFTAQVERDLGHFDDFHLAAWGDTEADTHIINIARQII
ncbi:hypothetical protein [Micromonospora parva]|uniref:hypothetical protein n=1 Tax=Micromonospora parva TaxID=1464048 RepID=UPI0033C1D12E